MLKFDIFSVGALLLFILVNLGFFLDFTYFLVEFLDQISSYDAFIVYFIYFEISNRSNLNKI